MNPSHLYSVVNMKIFSKFQVLTLMKSENSQLFRVFCSRFSIKEFWNFRLRIYNPFRTVYPVSWGDLLSKMCLLLKQKHKYASKTITIVGRVKFGVRKRCKTFSQKRVCSVIKYCLRSLNIRQHVTRCCDDVKN